MQHPDSKDYFERRAAEEARAADEAEDPRAAQSHRELARRYDEKARNGSMNSADGTVSGLPYEFRIIP